MHEGENPDDKKYTCEECNKSYKRPIELKYHIDTVHEGIVKLHQCGYCEKTFARPYKLKNHIKKMHGNGNVQVKFIKMKK